ncbi:MAG: hypothetical protein U9N61_00080 [Euryarchaeota archaeon]|nr:hypothetical protein [Euryarchaeota archaeon]
MTEITILDNGGETFDRYVVVIGKDVYTMSQHPSDPQGFNQYAGKAKDFDNLEDKNKVTITDDVLKAIIERI